MRSPNPTSVTDRRRSFLKQIVLGITALPVVTEAVARPKIDWLAGQPENEGFWELVKQQFAVPNNMIMANSANLCPSPRFVNDRVRQFQEELIRDVSFQNRSKYGDMRQQSIQKLSNYLGVNNSEVGITRNTSESNNIIVNGLELGKGDEVIIWDENHPTNNLSWMQRAKRRGFTVKMVSVSGSPESPEELLKLFSDQMTKNTRVLAFSHISNVSGIRMPAKELCQMAAERNILTLVDGAQSFGALDLDLKELGCDFYTASTHKWLMGPLENGILYMKASNIDKVWPDSIAPGWSEDKTTVDEKYCKLGQRNESTTAALAEVIDFHTQIGPGNIESRIQELHTKLKSDLSKEIPGIKFTTPMDPALSGGVTIFNVPGKEFMDLFQQLYSEHGIASAPMDGVRLSPTVINTMSDIDRIVGAVKAVAG